MSSVQKHTTPTPFSSYQQDSDNTPPWINDVRNDVRDVRRDTPEFALRARKTMAVKPEPKPNRRPLTAESRVFTRERCWDCRGKGKTGALLYQCPHCRVWYTMAQIEARGRMNWSVWELPCVEQCGRIASRDLRPGNELCRTCGGNGYLDEQRDLDELAQYIVQVVGEKLGIYSTMPVPMPAFATSEPTAPAPPPPHLEHPSAQPTVKGVGHMMPPLGNEETEF